MLDTDSFTAAVKQDPNVLAQIAAHRDDVYISAIAVRESIRGAMASVSFAESGKASLPVALRGLVRIVAAASLFPIVPYDEDCDRLYQSFQKSTLRIGPNDCRIAASARIHGATIVTSNLKDFEAIAESVGTLQLADWRS